MTFHEHFAIFSAWFWLQIADHLWQSTLFLGLIVLSVRLLNRAEARARYIVWLLGSVKLVLPLSLFAALGQWLNLGDIFTRATAIRVPGGVDLIRIVASDAPNFVSIQTTKSAASHSEFFCFLTLLWLFGCLLFSALWWKRSQSLKTILAGECKPATSREIDLLGNARIRLGLNFRANLVVSDSVPAPFVWGVLMPIIVLPRGLSQKLDDEELELVFMHELVHVARRDNLIGVSQMALCCLLWFHPLVWLVRRKLLNERERACDEAVVRHESRPQTYASSLLKVLKFGLYSRHPVAAGLANAIGSNLNKRLQSIMENKIKNTNPRWQRWVVNSTALLLGFVCFAAGFTAVRLKNAVKESLGGSTETRGDNANGENQGKTELVGQSQPPPDAPYKVVGNEDCPLKIIEVVNRVIPDSELPKSTEEAPVQKIYSDLEIKLTNASDKTITGAMTVIKYPQMTPMDARMQMQLQGNVFKGPPKLSIAPGESWSVKTYADAPNFSVAVAKISFDDNTVWTAKEWK